MNIERNKMCWEIHVKNDKNIGENLESAGKSINFASDLRQRLY